MIHFFDAVGFLVALISSYWVATYSTGKLTKLAAIAALPGTAAYLLSIALRNSAPLAGDLAVAGAALLVIAGVLLALARVRHEPAIVSSDEALGVSASA